MTNTDVLCEFMAELTGKPIEFVRSTFPVQIQAKELSDQEAADFLADLRKEGSGIVNWSLAGLRRAADRAGRRPSASRPIPE